MLKTLTPGPSPRGRREICRDRVEAEVGVTNSRHSPTQ
jgi:hypothetical protein